MAQPVGIAIPSGPLVDPESGEVMPSWRALFMSFYGRTGGSTGGVGTTQAALDAETAAREAADAALAASVSHEAATRAAADVVQSAAIAAETSGRMAMDALLAGGGLTGTKTNDNALAGQVGEYVTASRASGAAISLATNTAADVTSISLTAGDWDVEGAVTYGGTSATCTNMQSWINTASAAVPASPWSAHNILAGAAFAFVAAALPTGTLRVSIAATTAVHLGAFASFTSGSVTAYGIIRARRVR
jgi:hypothetical protein